MVLVKAVPRPSRRYGETVCCAGITLQRKWRRLFPVRFRQLKDNKFSRWQWVRYRWQQPRSDNRRESRHMFEDTLVTGSSMPEAERAGFLDPLIMGSVKRAKEQGDSLALIRPVESRFKFKSKSAGKIEAERSEYKAVGQQQSFMRRLGNNGGILESEAQSWRGSGAEASGRDVQ